MQDCSEYRLGESAGTLEFDGIGDNRALVRALAEQARRNLYLFTDDLDPAIYDDVAFVEAAAAMARTHPRNRILVLVKDSTRAVKEGHRLVQLGQRLSSRVEIRNPLPEYEEISENFLLSDGVGYVRRLLPARYEGTASFHDPLRARELSRLFDEVWERALPDPQLRRLHL